MPLQQSDMRFARSAVMADVPEGGGPPTAQLIPDGASNTIFPDVSEETRTTGRVEIRQIHTVLRNMDTAALLGANVIVAEPPNDPNVDITLMSTKDPFATKAKIVARIEGSTVASVEFNGYLLEDQGASQRSIQLFQRPGAEPPGVGKVYLLLYLPGDPGERRQRVRVKSVDMQVRMFSETVNGQLIDFQGQVTTVELFDPLLYDFPGSPASRSFARITNDPSHPTTALRETVYSDSGMFYGAARLTDAALATDSTLKLDTVYSRLVPSTRTEAISTNQRPASERAVVLAESPRRVEVGVTPHTQRIKIGQENLGFAYVLQLQPLPAPGTVVIHYWALGQRYTVTDDGEGRLTGAGSGLMSYLTGTVPLTLDALPDVGTMISVSWGETSCFVDRTSQGAQVRAPEYCWIIEGDSDDDRVVPGSLTIEYTSAGSVRTVTDNGAGQLAGDGSGVIDYASRSVLLRPAYMPDAGGELALEYDLEALVSETLAGGSPDAGGFITLALAQQPAAGTLQVSWATVREVSNTSGGQLDTTTAAKNSDVTATIRMVDDFYEPRVPIGATAVTWSSGVAMGG